jgi:hypothetical protein
MMPNPMSRAMTHFNAAFVSISRTSIKIEERADLSPPYTEFPT